MELKQDGKGGNSGSGKPTGFFDTLAGEFTLGLLIVIAAVFVLMVFAFAFYMIAQWYKRRICKHSELEASWALEESKITMNHTMTFDERKMLIN